MISLRLLCAIGFGCLAVPSHAEVISDAFVLYKKVCVASDGDLAKSELLALENGLSMRSHGHNRKTFDRASPTPFTAPFVVLSPADPDRNKPMNLCVVSGETAHMSEFDSFVQSQSLVEVEKEVGAASKFYLHGFATSEECLASDYKLANCRLVMVIGKPRVNEEFSGEFRLYVTAPNHLAGPQ